jgi:hypothetical protein
LVSQQLQDCCPNVATLGTSAAPAYRPPTLAADWATMASAAPMPATTVLLTARARPTARLRMPAMCPSLLSFTKWFSIFVSHRCFLSR